MDVKQISNDELINYFLNQGMFDPVQLASFKYFDPNYVNESLHICCFIKHELVGILEYKNKGDIFFVNYVTTHPNYRQRGVATALKRFFLNLIGEEATLVNSYYTEEGIVLIGLNQRLAEEFKFLNWIHKIEGEYQKVRGPLLKRGDNVVFKTDHLWIEGNVLDFFCDNRYQIKIKIIGADLNEYILDHSPDLIKLI